ncbi:GNAT family N-acetyltransferase [Vibrio vulnificus]|nr:GNAT family N-acetyltransferase [Vibrio vulnificus]EIU7061297.1 GNAT family N-acetyltransferase [Vibrio vulnificus]ELP5903277.1 GNAT family N-acetyltransferase [Vibrio vulnificus]ELV8759679.1 GNAT family N-acetyltransferase [Vibrio vulnificus]MCU8142143.1 GNAT family N-acetyltransferase [Vibrio vulnificus]
MMNTVLLDKAKHDRNRFNCGIEALNNYLKVMASQQAKKDNTRTFVLEDDSDNSHVIGFYTLTMTPIDLKALPDKLQKKHQSSTSGGLIARLAVDDRYKGKGFGEWLLIDALRKLLAASDSVAFPVVIVDAKDGAKHFYERYGFQVFEDAENKLFITIADVRASLG